MLTPKRHKRKNKLWSMTEQSLHETICYLNLNWKTCMRPLTTIYDPPVSKNNEYFNVNRRKS